MMPGADKQIAFTIGVIALGAKMAKVDGAVTKDEVHAFKEVFRVPESEAKNVARIFDLAKQDVAGFESYARQLARLFGDDPDMLHNISKGCSISRKPTTRCVRASATIWPPSPGISALATRSSVPFSPATSSPSGAAPTMFWALIRVCPRTICTATTAS